MQSRNGSEFGIILFPRSGVDANPDMLQCCSFISLNNYKCGYSTGSYVYVLFIHKKNLEITIGAIFVLLLLNQGAVVKAVEIDHHEFDFGAQKGFNKDYRKR